MTINLPASMTSASMPLAQSRLDGIGLDNSKPAQDENKVREQFQNTFGELLFGQMLSAMRKNVGEPAYFHGGRAEEIFTQQLDQQLARNLSKSSAEQFVGPMFDLTMTGRR